MDFSPNKSLACEFAPFKKAISMYFELYAAMGILINLNKKTLKIISYYLEPNTTLRC